MPERAAPKRAASERAAAPSKCVAEFLDPPCDMFKLIEWLGAVAACFSTQMWGLQGFYIRNLSDGAWLDTISSGTRTLKV